MTIDLSSPLWRHEVPEVGPDGGPVRDEWAVHVMHERAAEAEAELARELARQEKAELAAEEPKKKRGRPPKAKTEAVPTPEPSPPPKPPKPPRAYPAFEPAPPPATTPVELARAVRHESAHGFGSLPPPEDAGFTVDSFLTFVRAVRGVGGLVVAREIIDILAE